MPRSMYCQIHGTPGNKYTESTPKWHKWDEALCTCTYKPSEDKEDEFWVQRCLQDAKAVQDHEDKVGKTLVRQAVMGSCSFRRDPFPLALLERSMYISISYEALLAEEDE